jgi:hypothetical protein
MRNLTLDNVYVGRQYQISSKTVQLFRRCEHAYGQRLTFLVLLAALYALFK